MTATCSLDGCSNPTYARGMCCSHYKRALKARPPGAARPRRAVAEGDPSVTARTSLPELLAALAAALPPLHGASCRGHTELFDATVGRRGHHADTLHARAAAVDVCNACPALHHCRDWLTSLPADQRPLGIVAGRVITHPAVRRTQTNQKGNLP